MLGYCSLGESCLTSFFRLTPAVRQCQGFTHFGIVQVAPILVVMFIMVRGIVGLWVLALNLRPPAGGIRLSGLGGRFLFSHKLKSNGCSGALPHNNILH